MKKQLLIIILILGIAVVTIPIILLNLSHDITNPKWSYYIEPEIFTASEEVTIEGIIYNLETFMWLDFMPISPPNGMPLVVIIRVHALGIENFPLSISIGRLWLINGKIIISTLHTEEYSINGDTLEMAFLDGPKWETGKLVDVVVRLNGINLDYYYLKAANQKIYAMY